MSANELTYSPAIAEATNYNRWIFDVLSPAIRGRLLEIGVGAAPLISRYGKLDAWIAADIRRDAVDAATSRWRSLYGDKPVKGLVGDAGTSEFWDRLAGESVDGIIAVNVLEHVEDDGRFLRRAGELLSRSGGRLGIFVPAMQALYGTLDRAAGHYRRYGKAELKAKAEAAGFTVESIKYMNCLSPVVWWWQGRVRKVADLGDPSLNRDISLFDRWAVPVVRAIESLAPPPFGQSLVLIARANRKS